MATRVISFGTPIILGFAAEHAPTAGLGLVGAETVQLDLGGLPIGDYRQSDKFDYFQGGTSCPEWWFPRMSITPASAPAIGGSAELYLAFSDNATAANNNPGNLSGADSVYNGYGTDSTDADEQIGGQFKRHDALVFSVDSDTHVGDLRPFRVLSRYGIVVVRNSCSVAFTATATQMSVHLIPIIETIA